MELRRLGKVLTFLAVIAVFAWPGYQALTSVMLPVTPVATPIAQPLRPPAEETRATDTNEIVAGASARGMNPVIPPKSNRKEKRDYDRALYKLRHLVENGFLEFKQWRGVATRYAKNSLSYLAICQIRAMAIWTKLL